MANAMINIFFYEQLTLTEEQFMMTERFPVTMVTDLCNNSKDAAQKLLNHYVKVQGLSISQVCNIMKIEIANSVLE